MSARVDCSFPSVPPGPVPSMSFTNDGLLMYNYRVAQLVCALFGILINKLFCHYAWLLHDTEEVWRGLKYSICKTKLRCIFRKCCTGFVPDFLYNSFKTETNTKLPEEKSWGEEKCGMWSPDKRLQPDLARGVLLRCFLYKLALSSQRKGKLWPEVRIQRPLLTYLNIHTVFVLRVCIYVLAEFDTRWFLTKESRFSPSKIQNS
jgi:hypothetical protein